LTDLPAKEPVEQAGNQAQKNRGGHGKVEAEAAPLDHDVARQAANWQLAEPRPQESHDQEREAGDDQEFLHSDLAHAHRVDGGAAVPTGAAPVVRDAAVVRAQGALHFLVCELLVEAGFMRCGHDLKSSTSAPLRGPMVGRLSSGFCLRVGPRHQ